MKGYKHLNCEQRYTVAHIYKQSKAEDNFDAVAPSGSWTFFSPAICCSVSELLEALEDFVAEDAKYPA